MQDLFSKDLIAGSIKTQPELDAVFLDYPNLSRAYVAIALAKIEIREWYEKWWPKLAGHLDENFVTEFQKEESHLQRAWEFHLGAALIEKGMALEETANIGPDFCLISPDGKKIWIEAVSCDLGSTDRVDPMPDMVPGVLYDFSGNIEDINRPRVLRITNAISSKLKVFNGYLNNGESGVGPDDCLIVAVGGVAIQHHSEPRMLFKRAVFGQGPDTYVRVAGEEKLKGPFYKPSPTVIKHTSDGRQEEISATFLELPSLSRISAVIYCGHKAYDCPLDDHNIGDCFLFGYHTNPINPIPENFFKFGKAIRKNPVNATITEKQQS